MIKPNVREVGKRIETIRKEANYSITEFSNIMGVAYTTIQNWEKGQAIPKKEALEKIALLGKVPSKQLLYGNLVDDSKANDLAKPDPYKVGERIKAIRLKLGYSISDFGKLVDGSSPSTVAGWEKGKSLPQKNKIKIIALLGRVNKLELLYGKSE